MISKGDLGIQYPMSCNRKKKDKLIKPSMPHPCDNSFSVFPVILRSRKHDMKTTLNSNSRDFLCEFM